MTRNEHKPKHSPYRYIKKNSQLGVALALPDEKDETTNRWIYESRNEHAYYYEYDEEDFLVHGSSKTIPIALVWKLQQLNDDGSGTVLDSENFVKPSSLPNFIMTKFNDHYYTRENEEQTTLNIAKHYRPCYLFVAVQKPSKHHCYVSHGCFGFLKLCKMGFQVDSNQRLHILDEVCICFPISMFIHQCTENYFKFIIVGERKYNATLEINQECITKSKFHIEYTNDPDTVDVCRVREHVFWPAAYGSNKNTSWMFMDYSYLKQELQFQRQYLTSSCKIDVKESWSAPLPLKYRKDLCMYMEYQNERQYSNDIDDKHAMERYLLVYRRQQLNQQCSSNGTHGITLLQMQLGESQVFLRPTNFLNFGKLFDSKHNIKLLSCCKLSNSKYLIMSSLKGSEKFNYSRYKATSFQELFIHSILWVLIDLENKLVKRVYPRVYHLSKRMSDDGFQQVSKKKYCGKRLPTIMNDFEDGDLNGGYSDVHLLQLIASKNEVNNTSVNASTCHERNDISLCGTNIKKDIETIAFRPFPSNPDLFQVMVFFKTNLVNDWRQPTRNAPDYGKIFRFYFKLRDECGTRLSITFEHYRDITIVTCQ
ncbi:hypothetical protein C9374_007962 [Naegleria lovaniensis]|uniref:Uncharacterized protein n=1 Tax=Naegleria lovaniensis TaxID=51637 RepID=A0AA88GJT3_NAELO|nr:uncharacterized protein C9374_007962 [Naegleria lovaniensis]KAG2378814.1 hypothetical protein C9374_007962 [Naegleria lovaniensis]